MNIKDIRELIGSILMILGSIGLIGGIIYLCWSVHPAFGIVVGSALAGVIGKSMVD